MKKSPFSFYSSSKTGRLGFSIFGRVVILYSPAPSHAELWYDGDFVKFWLIKDFFRIVLAPNLNK